MIPDILAKGGEGGIPEEKAKFGLADASPASAPKIYFAAGIHMGSQPHRSRRRTTGSSTPPSLALRLRSE